MIEEARARTLVRTEDGQTLGTARPLKEGWYFPFRYQKRGVIGAPQGAVVNRKTGRVLVIAGIMDLERALGFYDLGYQFENYDLVVLEVLDRARTLETLAGLSLSVIDLSYEAGTVWRIARSMRRDEIEAKLDQLPAIFPRAQLNHRAEALETARERDWFRFKMLNSSAYGERGLGG